MDRMTSSASVSAGGEVHPDRQRRPDARAATVGVAVEHDVDRGRHQAPAHPPSAGDQASSAGRAGRAPASPPSSRCSRRRSRSCPSTPSSCCRPSGVPSCTPPRSRTGDAARRSRRGTAAARAESGAARRRRSRCRRGAVRRQPGRCGRQRLAESAAAARRERDGIGHRRRVGAVPRRRRALVPCRGREIDRVRRRVHRRRGPSSARRCRGPLRAPLDLLCSCCQPGLRRPAAPRVERSQSPRSPSARCTARARSASSSATRPTSSSRDASAASRPVRSRRELGRSLLASRSASACSAGGARRCRSAARHAAARVSSERRASVSRCSVGSRSAQASSSSLPAVGSGQEQPRRLDRARPPRRRRRPAHGTTRRRRARTAPCAAHGRAASGEAAAPASARPAVAEPRGCAASRRATTTARSSAVASSSGGGCRAIGSGPGCGVDVGGIELVRIDRHDRLGGAAPAAHAPTRCPRPAPRCPRSRARRRPCSGGTRGSGGSWSRRNGSGCRTRCSGSAAARIAARWSALSMAGDASRGRPGGRTGSARSSSSGATAARLTATSSPSTRSAAPSSIAAAARSTPAARSSTRSATTSPAAAFSTTMSRIGPGSALRAPPVPRRRSRRDRRRRDPRASPAPGPRTPGVTSRSGELARRAPPTTSVGPVVVSSSSPSLPCTTQAWSMPRRAQHLGDQVHQARIGHADDLAGDPAGVRQRTEHVEHRRDAQLGPHRCDVAHRRVEHAGEGEADAGLTHAGRDGGPVRARPRRRAPRAGRSNPRPTTPCGCRACRPSPRPPAATTDAMVETLNARPPSAEEPPVPTRSIVGDGSSSSSGAAAASIASTSPSTSSTDSPFIRSATMNAAIWASVASPASTTSSARAGDRGAQVATGGQLAQQPRPGTDLRERPHLCRPRRPGVRRPAQRAAPSTSRPTPSVGAAHRTQATATTDDALALTLGGTTPDAVVLAVADGVLQAVLLHRALGSRPPWPRRPPRRWTDRRWWDRGPCRQIDSPNRGPWRSILPVPQPDDVQVSIRAAPVRPPR